MMVVISLAAMMAVTASRAHAGEDAPAPVITDARVFTAGGTIACDVTSRALFPERVVRTIQSGLPATVELLYAVVSGRDAVDGGLHVWRLQYDVWEDFYSVAGPDTTRRFASFDAMASMMEHLRGVPIVPLTRLKTEAAYAIRLSVAVHPLRGGDGSGIAGWVGETARGDAEEGWREQLLNLNDLIQHFFAREKDSGDRSAWFETRPFVPRELPVDAVTKDR